MLYFDDILVQDIDEEEERRRNLEKRLKTMQFERPWLIVRFCFHNNRKDLQTLITEKVSKITCILKKK